MAQGNPNLPNAGIADVGCIITNADGTTAKPICTGPAADLSANPPKSGGYKIGKLTLVSTDTTAGGNYVQISKAIGGTAYPVGDPVLIPAATTKGTFTTATVDLLSILYGGIPANLAPGAVLQAQMSSAVAVGKQVSILVDGPALF